MHIDCSGILSDKKSLSAKDQVALSTLKKSTELVNGNYEIGLHYKIKLARKPQLCSLYEASIAKDIKKGYMSVLHDSSESRRRLVSPTPPWYQCK